MRQRKRGSPIKVYKCSSTNERKVPECENPKNRKAKKAKSEKKAKVKLTERHKLHHNEDRINASTNELNDIRMSHFAQH
jgi:hypothetical protein